MDYAKIRQFDREKDAALVAGWWEARGQDPVHPSEFTQFGIIAEILGVPVACAWFYVNNRSVVATVENMVSDPSADEEHIKHASEVILEFFRQEAEKISKVMEVDAPFVELELPLIGGADYCEDIIDRCEDEIAKVCEEGDLPLKHTFTPGLYTREIFIPARTILTSRIHMTEHPFVISKGDISVWTKETGTVRMKAPHSGVTRPGTRRLLFAHDDTIWTTFHPTDETDVDTIVNKITKVRLCIEEGK